MPGPSSHRFAPNGVHRFDNAVERLIPACLAPGAARAALPDHGMEHSIRVADDLARCVSADAQKALAVRILLVTADRDDASVFDLDEHAAQGRVAIHRTHRPADA